MERGEKNGDLGEAGEVCESMNVFMCVLAERMCAPLPLIHSQL